MVARCLRWSMEHTGCCREGLASTGGSAAYRMLQGGFSLHWRKCSSLQHPVELLVKYGIQSYWLDLFAHYAAQWGLQHPHGSCCCVVCVLPGQLLATIPSRSGHEQPATRDCHPFPRTPTLQTQPTLCILPPPGNHNPTPTRVEDNIAHSVFVH